MAYLDAVDQVGALHLIGTTLNEIQLKKFLPLLDRDSEILIAGTSVSTLDLFRAEIDQDIKIISSSIGNILGDSSEFHNQVRIQDSVINRVSLEESTFQEHVNFSGTRFGDALFTSASFHGRASFSKELPDSAEDVEVEDIIGEAAAVFKSSAIFMGADFHQLAMFAGVEFRAGVSFFEATFHDGGSFEEIDVKIGIQFDAVTFNGGVRFESSSLGLAGFRSAEFNDRSVFDSVTFGRSDFEILKSDPPHIDAEDLDLSLIDNFEKSIEIELFKRLVDESDGVSALFTNCEVNGRIEFTDCESTSNIDAQQSDINLIELDVSPAYDYLTVVLDESDIKSGEFRINQGCYIQLVDSVLGRVNLQEEEIEDPIDYLFIDNTSFDGFDFTKHRNLFRRQRWLIDGGKINDQHRQSDHRESTYAKAKEGARKQGDALATTEFFVKELRCRRENHKNSISRSDEILPSLKSLIDMISNDLFYVTSRYAESPRLVSLWSAFTIFLFAILYIQHSIDVPYDPSISIPIVVSYPHPELKHIWDMQFIYPNYESFHIGMEISGLEFVIFSIQSFTAFLLPGGASITDPTIRLLTSLESFVGTFWIGLFISTIVRSLQK